MSMDNPEEAFNFSEIEDFLRSESIADSVFETELIDFESTEVINLGIVVASIKNSTEIAIPETLDMDKITLKDLTGLLSWQNNDKENFLRVIRELTFALDGIQKGLLENVSQVASSIAHFDFLTNQQVMDWIRVIEDLTQLKILSGDKFQDEELIADLDLLEEERIQLERLAVNIKFDVAQDLAEELGDHRDIDKIAENLFRFAERLYIQLIEEGNVINQLNYQSIFAKNEIQRISKGFLSDQNIINHILRIFKELQLDEYRRIEYPIFEPKNNTD